LSEEQPKFVKYYDTKLVVFIFIIRKLGKFNVLSACRGDMFKQWFILLFLLCEMKKNQQLSLASMKFPFNNLFILLV